MRHQKRWSAALSEGRCIASGRRTATKLRPRWRAVPSRLRPPATTINRSRRHSRCSGRREAADRGAGGSNAPPLRRPLPTTLCTGQASLTDDGAVSDPPLERRILARSAAWSLRGHCEHRDLPATTDPM
jgi:hypothetical protein